MNKKHWHSMNGSIGCLPDCNEVFSNKRDAIDFLCELFEEARGLQSRLQKYHICYDTEVNLIGADYCEIFECYDNECIEYMEKDY